MENHLFNQNSYITHHYADNIRAIKIHELLKSPNPKNIIDRLDIDVIVIDESHYGVGQESRLDKLIAFLSSKCPQLIIIWVGATGYQLVHSNIIDDTIQMIVPKEYYGVSDILKSDKFIDNDDFKYVIKANKNQREKAGIEYGGGNFTFEFKKALLYLKSFSDGLGIVRVNSIKSAISLQEALNDAYPYAKVLVATSDTGISDTVKDAQMISRKKRAILIVVQGLKAGVDLGNTKSSIRFVIETYKTMAAVSQGLIGRICGYHENRDCLVIANRKALELQSKYENDYRVINDDFLQELFGLGNTSLAANLSLGSKRQYKSDDYYGGKVYKLNNIDELTLGMFGNYTKDYFYSIKKVMARILKEKGNYAVQKTDHPSTDNRINTIQSEKFSKREMFDAYLNKMDKTINFSSIFHRFAKTSEGRRRGGLKGGRSNEQYSKDIKVGILYDDTTKTFYLAVRDENKTKTETVTNMNNKSIFNK